MILTQVEIAEKIRNPKSAGEISAALEMRKYHRLHVSGVGYKHWWMKRNERIESQNSYELKRELSGPRTPRIFESIKKNYFKIFRAQGFVKNYKFSGPDQTDKMDEILSDVCEGRSLDKFMQDVWFPAVFEEFNGFIEVAVKSEEEQNDEYPFKIKLHPITEVHDVKIKGVEVEYIILKLRLKIAEKEVDAYRVIDGATDTVYVQNGNDFVIHTVDGKADQYPNYFGKVPFIQPSTMNVDVMNDFLKKTVITAVIPNATTYQSIADDHIVSVKLHQHPQFYSFPVTCPTCNGTKQEQYYSDDEKFDGNAVPLIRDCTGCKGRGMVAHWKADTTQGISLPIGEDFEKTGYPAAQPPAGYVTPDLESMIEQREEMRMEKEAIEMGSLGIAGITTETRSQKTAMEVEMDLQPLFDSFSAMSSMAEQVHKFLVDCIGYVQFGKQWEGCYIKYGRKYLVRSDSAITKELEEARTAGASDTYIRELMEEQIYVRFEDNPMARNRALMVLDLEPFSTHPNVTDIPLYAAYTSKVNLVLKTNFTEYIDRFEAEKGPIVLFGGSMDYRKKIETIKAQLLVYANEELTNINKDAKENQNRDADPSQN